MILTISHKDYEKFGDSINLLNNGEDQFKPESESYVLTFISTIRNVLKVEANIVDICGKKFNNLKEFEEWLYNDINIELGINIIDNLM
ncbi:hypothetical protein [Paraclostridium sordellii]|uniref:hypothetical protein n=1 Tax=Paraclostridium sordellii TaxID=1505 RepID=UPI00189C0F09|nr:hypothetical protein [Paeniclostridium sordellii]